MEPLEPLAPPLRSGPRAKALAVLLALALGAGTLLLLRLSARPPRARSFYAFEVKDAAGRPVSLEKFRGKVSLGRRGPVLCAALRRPRRAAVYSRERARGPPAPASALAVSPSFLNRSPWALDGQDALVAGMRLWRRHMRRICQRPSLLKAASGQRMPQRGQGSGAGGGAVGGGPAGVRGVTPG